jgi:hypothetical protein
MWEST